MQYFSSDFHLGHKNVLKYDPRPFKTIEEHDEAIIGNYNSMVKDKDDFFFLGDFALSTIGRAEKYISQLKGNLYFIKGNHDKKDNIWLYKKYGTYLGQQEKIRVGEQEIILNHFKMCIWDKSHHGSWHLYGHSHGTSEHLANGSKSFDIGINLTNYFPLSFDQIKERMDKLPGHIIDHHTRHTNK